MDTIKTLCGIVLFVTFLGFFLSEVDQGIELFLVVVVLLGIPLLWIVIEYKRRPRETSPAPRQDNQ